VHPETWWAAFPATSPRFDPAYLVDGLGDLITRKIAAPLLRQEVTIATDMVVRALNRPGNAELAGLAAAAADRLTGTLARFAERSTGSISTVEAAAMEHALHGRYARAAAEAEPFVGTVPLLRLFLTSLRLERFDIPLALRLLEAGRDPDEAVRSGLLIGRYSWWPAWLLHVVTERALAGTLDDGTVAALDRLAYAELSPFQARLARRLLSGETGLIEAAAERLEGLGEPEAAERLRDGDLTAVALAARLVPR
jgi:hypothetical protein